MTAAIAILRARRAGLVRLRAADRPMRIECLGAACGLCCSVMGGGVVVQDHHDANRLPSTALGKCRTGSVLSSNEGACTFYKSGMCSVYQQRPRGCREYPWYNIDGRLYYDKGCPGVRFDTEGRPPVWTIAAVEKYFPFSGWVQRLLKLILRVW